ncbi:hypothetical protein GCM10007108_08850 [Thermogymnomonas acidicola]|uniref:N-(5'-phosphoribosyl)anthranilate isomerase n=1 Tax=Thermogymnomonas acidicola TaxID=399579 RepID=A0AA37F9C1_9ARCH|nr:hypothetical protein [Thermogymnomonas acidicola]GGM73029.1 hypothetical protein GCM10007108_08850 [Thermogymnomonas acidicola]
MSGSQSCRGRETLFKVCGITNVDDAVMAAGAGADMVGVIMDKKVVRHGDRRTVEEIASMGIPVVTVHTSMPASVGSERYVQLHFPHGAREVEEARSMGVGVISVVNSGTLGDMLSRYSECREAGSEIVLVEDRSGIARRTDILEAFSGLPGVGFAGNVSSADLETLMRFRPRLIDLSRSLEAEPGKKDARKVEEFFREVRRLAPLH